jgi:hypothetical protein
VDYFGERREGPTVGPTRGENQCCNAEIEAMIEGHEYHRTIKRHTGDEDPTNIIENCIDQ